MKASLSQSAQKWTPAVASACSAAQLPSRHVITLRTSKLSKISIWLLPGIGCCADDVPGSLLCLRGTDGDGAAGSEDAQSLLAASSCLAAGLQLCRGLPGCTRACVQGEDSGVFATCSTDCLCTAARSGSGHVTPPVAPVMLSAFAASGRSAPCAGKASGGAAGLPKCCASGDRMALMLAATLLLSSPATTLTERAGRGSCRSSAAAVLHGDWPWLAGQLLPALCKAQI